MERDTKLEDAIEREKQAPAPIESPHVVCVYLECGGPEPRTEGCGQEIKLVTPREVMAAMRGARFEVICPRCGKKLVSRYAGAKDAVSAIARPTDLAAVRLAMGVAKVHP